MNWIYLLFGVCFGLIMFGHCENSRNATKRQQGPTREDLRNIRYTSMKRARKNGRPVHYEAQEYNHMDQAFKSFLGTFKHVLFFAVGMGPTGGIASNIAGTFGGIILDVYLRASGVNKLGVWDQIREKVESKISQAMTISHFDDIRTEFAKMPVLFRRGEKFNEKDLMEIVNLKHEVFPQDESEVTYSQHWAPTMICWMMHVMAGYMEYRRYNPKGSCTQTSENNCIGACGLANEMIVMRREVIYGIHSLYRKRYQTIKGVKFTKSPDGGNNAPYSQLALQFWDQAADIYHPPSADFHRDTRNGRTVKEDVLDRLIKEVHDVAEMVRTFFNENVDGFVGSKIFEGCQPLPTKIPKFYSDKYNTKFYGDATGSETPCKLPCQRYGGADYWCPNDNILNEGSSTYGKYERSPSVNWGYCEPPDYEKLIPTRPTVDSWLAYKDMPNNVLEFESIFSDEEAADRPPPSNTFLRYGSSFIGSYGTWGEYEGCPGSYVVAFRTGNDFGNNDDNAGITSIGLKCNDGTVIQSKMANDGRWSSWRACSRGYTGAQIAYNDHYRYPGQGSDDKVGVVALNLRCSEPTQGSVEIHKIQATSQDVILEHSKTKTSPMETCGHQQAICGIKTKIHDPWSGDEAGIVGVTFECCNFQEHFFTL